MRALDRRLVALEGVSRSARFSPEEMQRAWSSMAWQARIKLVSAEGVPTESDPELLAEMTRSMGNDDVARMREKLAVRFPCWLASLQGLSDLEVYALNYDWPTWARKEQLLPESGLVCLEAFLEFAGSFHAPK